MIGNPPSLEGFFSEWHKNKGEFLQYEGDLGFGGLTYGAAALGSTASNARFFDLDTGEELKAYPVSGAVQADLPKPLAEGESVRIRVMETYTDPVGYRMEKDQLVWDRTLGRPRNQVTLPAGWMLTESTAPAIVSLDAEGRVVLRFTNPRNDEIHVILKARKR